MKESVRVFLMVVRCTSWLCLQFHIWYTKCIVT